MQHRLRESDFSRSRRREIDPVGRFAQKLRGRGALQPNRAVAKRPGSSRAQPRGWRQRLPAAASPGDRLSLSVRLRSRSGPSAPLYGEPSDHSKPRRSRERTCPLCGYCFSGCIGIRAISGSVRILQVEVEIVRAVEAAAGHRCEPVEAVAVAIEVDCGLVMPFGAQAERALLSRRLVSRTPPGRSAFAGYLRRRPT